MDTSLWECERVQAQWLCSCLLENSSGNIKNSDQFVVCFCDVGKLRAVLQKERVRWGCFPGRGSGRSVVKVSEDVSRAHVDDGNLIGARREQQTAASRLD